MDTYKEFCIRFWESTRNLDLYSIDGTQLDRLIVDALSKTNGGEELIKTSMNELSVLIRAINHNNRKIQSPSLPSNLDEAAEDSWALYEYRESPKGLYSTCYIDGFKAGAEWAAEQGVTKEAVIGMATKDIEINVSGRVLDKLELGPGDKVIVQIRKK